MPDVFLDSLKFKHFKRISTVLFIAKIQAPLEWQRPPRLAFLAQSQSLVSLDFTENFKTSLRS